MPRVTTKTESEVLEEEILSIQMIHPENYRPSAGGNMPSSKGLPIGPETAIDWYMWEHVWKEFIEMEITRTITVTTVWCEEERNCETLRFNYDDIDEVETKKEIDRYRRWLHKKLYKAGSNSVPLP